MNLNIDATTKLNHFRYLIDHKVFPIYNLHAIIKIGLYMYQIARATITDKNKHICERLIFNNPTLNQKMWKSDSHSQKRK